MKGKEVTILLNKARDIICGIPELYKEFNDPVMEAYHDIDEAIDRLVAYQEVTVAVGDRQARV